MTISEFCIRRPVATLLMSVSLVIAGLFAYISLPVAALPRADFPVINVSAQLPGASAETMATSVATPLIKQFATIAGIDSISTTNSLGSTSIAIQFELDRDIDAAASDVQSAIARTQRALPDDMPAPPSYRKVNPADAPILLLALKSDIVPLTDLDAFAQQVISPSLSTLNGVAQVSIFGSQQFAVQDPARRGGARRPRHIGRRDPGGRGGGQPEHAARHLAGRPAAIDDRRRHAARQCRRLLQAHRQKCRRQIGAARRRHARHRFRRQQPDRKLV